MKTVVSVVILSLFLMFSPAIAPADDFFIFPADGQTAKQLETDKAECIGWATRQSGFDPIASPKATTPPPTSTASSGGGGRRILRGAAIGAAVGSLSGDMGDGAAIGAGSSVLFGGMRRRDQQQRDVRARKQWEAEQTAIYSRNRRSFDKAYKLCLEAKDYAVTEK